MTYDPHNPPASDGISRLGRAMSYLTWALVVTFLTWGFSKVYNAQRNPNQHVQGAKQLDGTREVRLQRNKFGHYVATGSINAQPVEFMVDTGATGIAIPGGIARKLRLAPGQTGRVLTAGGEVAVFVTRLETIELGGIALHDVQAHINPHMDGLEILLGMTFLKEVDFAQRGDILMIREHPR